MKTLLVIYYPEMPFRDHVMKRIMVENSGPAIVKIIGTFETFVRRIFNAFDASITYDGKHGIERFKRDLTWGILNSDLNTHTNQKISTFVEI